MFNLEMAVQDCKAMQDFDSEGFPIGAEHSQKVKAAEAGKSYGLKDCVDFPSRAAVSRFKLACLFFLSIQISLMAGDCCSESGRVYVGAFGGGIFSNSTEVIQMGTAFFTEAEGGPLAVYAKGDTKTHSSGFGGAQIGYEWASINNCSSWSFAPAAELEAFYYSNKKNGHLINSTERLPEHDFKDSFRLNSTVCLVNAVISVKNGCRFSPYIGGGIGAAYLSIRHAKSLQVDPPEEGINHFNSETHDTTWAFAAQAKIGILYQICERLHVFGEYRYLFVDSSNYIFGSTVYSDHVPTSPWNVKIKSINHNAFALGVRYDL